MYSSPLIIIQWAKSAKNSPKECVLLIWHSKYSTIFSDFAHWEVVATLNVANTN